MDYQNLVDIYIKLESTSKRLQKTKIISDFLKEVKTGLAEIILLLQGRVFPKHEDTKIGIASKLVLKAISTATGHPAAKIEKEWKHTGDLGLTVENLTSKKPQSTLVSHKLSVSKVFDNIRKLSTLEGMGSVDRKIRLISELLTSAHPKEARYIVRTLLEDLRVGIGEGTVRDAIVWAYLEPRISLEEDDIKIEDREHYNKSVASVQEAYDMTNDFAVTAELAKQGKLDDVELKIGRPVKVMLALKVSTAEEGLEKCGKPAAVEYKLDGFRLQIHKEGEKVTLFTRRLEDVTAQFPDVVKSVRESVKGSCILDAEAVGYSPKTKKYLPFQSISQRIKRKYDIDEIAEKFPVEANVFDILYHKKSMLKIPFRERRKMIEKLVTGKPYHIVCVEHILADDPKKINGFFKKSIDAGNEGLMLKSLDAPYKPGARVGHMVKLKETMENLDLVIIAAEWGEGKRANWLSSFTMACRDDNGGLVEIGKVSTGLKEKREEGLSFDEVTELLKPLIISEKGREVIVKPKIVLEIAYEEIQKSPTYRSGYALRFPRIILLRDDRGIGDITDISYVEELYYSQKK